MRPMDRREWGMMALGGCAAAWAGCRAKGGSGGGELVGRVDDARSEAVVEFRGKRVLAYAFEPRQFKPYVREWYTLRGESLLRDAPADHLHHHGLMYAIRVNGVNFWEERETSGRQVSDGTPTWNLERGAGGRPQGILEHRIRWQPPGADSRDKAFLVERRRLKVSVDAGLEEVALEWDAAFEVGPGSAEVKLDGSVYFGLGMRLPASLDRVAQFRNSEGTSYSEAQTQDLIRGRWSSVTGKVDDREITVALGVDAANPGTSTFFSMRNGFAYLSATQDLTNHPLVYTKGKSYRLRYLLLAYPAAQNERYLSGRFAEWRPRG